MSLILGNLPSNLAQLHLDLCSGMGKSGTTREEKYKEFVINTIDGFAVNVIVNMVRVRQSTPAGMQVCGGKLCQDTAKVTVNPSNEKVENAIAGYFKSYINPSVSMPSGTPMFDEVVINDKKVI